MTDMVKKFNIGAAALGQGDAKARGFKKGVEAINLAAIFQARGITFGAPDMTGNEM